jgi:hypothetical protein
VLVKFPRFFQAAALALVASSACQSVLGDFEVAPAPPEAPSELGTACEPDAWRCTDAFLETCNGSRTGFITVATCASAAECNASTRSCGPCSAGDHRCSGNVLEVCDANAAWMQQSLACDTAALCRVAPDHASGTCATAACPTPGGYQCNGALLERCAEGRDRWDPIELCETPELCAASVAQVAAGQEPGRCQAPACEPNSFSCDGAKLRRCAFDRTTWEAIETCDSADLCNVTKSDCAACDPGTIECNGAELRRCSDSGVWQPLETCAAAALCDESAERCTAPECDTPGALRCGHDNEPILERCSPSLTWEIADACDTVQLCSVSAGSCLPPACVAGAMRCTGARHEQCSNDRTRWKALRTCGAGEVCDPSMGCVPGPCQEAVVRCNGASLERCVSGRFQELKRCESEALCDAGTSECQAPEPGCSARKPFKCEGLEILKCSSGLDDTEGFWTCGAGETCDANPAFGSPQCDVCTPNVYECRGLDVYRCNADGQASEKVGACPTLCTPGADDMPPTCR